MEPDAIEERAAALYGGVDWRDATGLLQVAAIHGPSDRILAIGPEAPPSPTDRFVLGLARARADVLVTTGGILRAEPDLVHRYAEDADEERALREWRRRALGRSAPPRILVLSGSGRFPRTHPALVSGRGWIWTSRSGADEIGDPPSGFTVVVADSDRGTAPDAITWLCGELGAEGGGATILLEAGPSTTRSFYGPEAARPVDELLLSRFEGAILEAAEGPDFVPAEERRAHFGAARSTCDVEEDSGRWIFERFRRERA